MLSTLLDTRQDAPWQPKSRGAGFLFWGPLDGLFGIPRRGKVRFCPSDLLLGLYATLLNDPMRHVTCTFLLYPALLILTW